MWTLFSFRIECGAKTTCLYKTKFLDALHGLYNSIRNESDVPQNCDTSAPVIITF